MSNAFVGHAKSLSELYTFYARLNESGSPHPLLGKYVSSTASRITGQTKKYSESSNYVRSMAAAEFQKEKQLLAQIFKVNLNIEGYDKIQDYKEVIETINSYLNLKQVYQRNVQLIKNTAGMKGVYSWYPTYFMQVWNERWDSIQAQFFNQWIKGQDAGPVLQSILDKELPDICVEGIRRMLDGPELETQKIDPELKNAYKDLVNYIGTINTKGSMASQIYEIYKLDEIKQALVNSFTGKTSILDSDFNSYSTVEGKVKYNIHARGGFSLEALETAVLQMISSGIKGASVFHSGKSEMKADNILTFNINSSLLEETIRQAGNDRQRNIDLLSDLGNKLDGIQEGFIVYSSDKNYTLNSKFGGFSVGSTGATAQAFISNVYKGDSYAGNSLLGAINQLGAGAMLEGQEGPYEMILAQEIAYMLFDDFSTIGVSTSTGQAIHIMNLNGIMMPLSAILSLLGDAIDKLDESEIRKIVNVSIKAPAIIFGTDNEQWDWMESNNATAADAWNYQRANTLKNTTITAHILRNFKDIVSQFL